MLHPRAPFYHPRGKKLRNEHDKHGKYAAADELVWEEAFARLTTREEGLEQASDASSLHQLITHLSISNEAHQALQNIFPFSPWFQVLKSSREKV